MKIGAVSRTLKIPASSIRYYERVGLINQIPRVSGCREFGDRELFRLKFIQLAQAAGFSLAEIRSLLHAYSASPESSNLWHSKAVAKQSQVRAQIENLKRTDAILSKLIHCSCASFSQCVSAADSYELTKAT